MYYPRSRFQRNLDGAYFGTTFPHLLLMSYPQLRPSRPLEAYQPRVFGFKLHASALRCVERSKPCVRSELLWATIAVPSHGRSHSEPMLKDSTAVHWHLGQ